MTVSTYDLEEFIGKRNSLTFWKEFTFDQLKLPVPSGEAELANNIVWFDDAVTRGREAIDRHGECVEHVGSAQDMLWLDFPFVATFHPADQSRDQPVRYGFVAEKVVFQTPFDSSRDTGSDTEIHVGDTSGKKVCSI